MGVLKTAEHLLLKDRIKEANAEGSLWSTGRPPVAERLCVLVCVLVCLCVGVPVLVCVCACVCVLVCLRG